MIPADDFDLQAYKLEGELRLAIAKAYQSAVDAIDLDALADAIAADDEAAISAILSIDIDRQDDLYIALGNGLIYALLGGIVIAMKAFASRHSSRVDTLSEAPRINAELRRNVIEPLAQRAQQSMMATLKTLRGSGLDPMEIAEAIRQSLNLAPDQALSAARFRLAFRDALTHPKRRVQGDAVTIPQAVRTLIKGRHYGYLNAAQRSVMSHALMGEMTTKDTARLVNRHARALANYRHDVIARQEAIRAINAGEYLAFRQGTANRSIPRSARRYWQTVGDERVRHNHRLVPGLNEQGVGVGQMFQTPLGPVLYPPLEVNCRCRVAIPWPDLAG